MHYGDISDVNSHQNVQTCYYKKIGFFCHSGFIIIWFHFCIFLFMYFWGIKNKTEMEK